MGLDMYLEKMPRYESATAIDVYRLEQYFDWKRKQNEYTFEKWCGIKYEDVPTGEIRKFYEPLFKIKYANYDTEKKFGYGSLMEEVGYWRKVNAIHNWFVKNVQDGIDDCNYHNEVTKEKLEELLDICNTVVNSYYKNDLSTVSDLLPTQSGFFFGSTDYDKWYIKDIEDTIDIILEVLNTTNFEKEMIYYRSSW